MYRIFETFHTTRHVVFKQYMGIFYNVVQIVFDLFFYSNIVHWHFLSTAQREYN